MLQSRYYNVGGRKWEARFFRKGEFFPDTLHREVPKQGVWARPESVGWERAVFLGISWRFVTMESAVEYLSERT